MTIRQEIDVQNLWHQYEGIAMHFNDLLIKLRTQSLAGVAAVSSLVGVFSKEGPSDIHIEWVVARAIFAALIGFWIAICCLDLGYYNRLLNGAVNAVIELENQTAVEGKVSGEIKMSKSIEAQFAKPFWNWKKRSYDGVLAFYAIVLFILVLAFFFAHSRS
jgi:hypothetical protein